MMRTYLKRTPLTKAGWLYLIIGVILMVYAGPALGHGVQGRITPQTGMQVNASYDDGEPMAYAAVEVTHADEKLPFQTGRTDRNGCFVFLPDKPGDWRVVVNDGMGHQLSLTTQLDKNLELNKESGPEKTYGALSRPEKALMGIAIIFGLSGVFFWWRGRAEMRKVRDAKKTVS
ncbi:MAG: carboxypeptidase regulatory-like domain-containing protein [Desulfobacterales bacterium]|nr:carboxypeptidase regulatory-like domain-containing protein [Desulfobacterales bacterium]